MSYREMQESFSSFKRDVALLQALRELLYFPIRIPSVDEGPRWVQEGFGLQGFPT